MIILKKFIMPRTKFNKVKPKLSYNITDEPIIISKATIDLFLKSGEYRNCMSLYAFYYCTAKWQKTNQPKGLFPIEDIQKWCEIKGEIDG